MNGLIADDHLGSLFEENHHEWKYVGPPALDLVQAHLRVREEGVLRTDGRRRSPNARTATLTRFGYYFEPYGRPGLKQWRIELHPRDGLHANPDESCPGQRHRLGLNDLTLNIFGFNLLLAIETSQRYLTTDEYPLDRRHGAKYNEVLDRVRRQIS